MRDAERLEHEERPVRLDRGASAVLRVERWAVGGDVPLAVERLALPSGPTRPAVMLVHGLAQNRLTWHVGARSMAGWLAAQGWEVLNLELRGHGRSRMLGAPAAGAFDDYVDDVARAVSAHGGEPFLIGHSLGAAAILAAATKVPTAGIVHLAGVFDFARNNAALQALAALTRLFERPLAAMPVRLGTGWVGKALSRGFRLADLSGYGLPISGWAPGSIEREVLEERLTDGFDWTSVAIWLQMSRWATGEPFAWSDAFAALDRPLLVIAGDQDPLVSPEDARRCYEASRSPDRELLVMNAFDHQVHWGHIDLILGHKAPEELWPRLHTWMGARS